MYSSPSRRNSEATVCARLGRFIQSGITRTIRETKKPGEAQKHYPSLSVLDEPILPPPPLKPPTQSPTIVPCILPLPPRNITRLLFPDALLLSHSAATRSTDVDFFFDFFFPSLHSRLPQATEIFTSILVTYVERLVNHAPSSIHPLLFYFLFFLQFFFYSSTSVSLDRFSSVINAEQRDRALVTRKWRLTL